MTSTAAATFQLRSSRWERTHPKITQILQLNSQLYSTLKLFIKFVVDFLSCILFAVEIQKNCFKFFFYLLTYLSVSGYYLSWLSLSYKMFPTGVPEGFV